MGKSDVSIFVGGMFFLLFLLFMLFNVGTLETITGRAISVDQVFIYADNAIVERDAQGDVSAVLDEFASESDLACVLVYPLSVNQSEHFFNMSFVREGQVVSSAHFSHVPEASFSTIKNKKGAACAFNGTTAFECFAFLPEEDLEDGRWSCLVSFWNSTDNVKYLVPNLIQYGERVSSSGAPYLSASLPRVITLDELGNIIDLEGGDVAFSEGFVLDLSEYFKDGNNSPLTYKVSGARSLDAEIDDSGEVSFIVPEGYEGTESLVFFAFADKEKVVAPSVQVVVGSGVDSSEPEACVPFWTCGSYDFCVDGVQSRECVDQNACGTLEGQPLLSQSCTSSASDDVSSGGNSGDADLEGDIEVKTSGLSTGKIIALVFALLLLLGLIGGGIYFILRAKKQRLQFSSSSSSPQEETKNNSSTASSNTSLSNTSISNVAALDTYIRSALAKKQNANSLRTDLVQAGWPSDLVAQRVQELSLVLFVEEKMKLGFSKDVVKKSLLDRGWKQELIDKVFLEFK